MSSLRHFSMLAAGLMAPASIPARRPSSPSRVIWGNWLIVRDIWNSDVAPAAATPPAAPDAATPEAAAPGG
jgi:hypothetical protein